MAVFETSSKIPAPAEDLFRFHGNPHNLRAVSPPGMRIIEIRAEEEPRIGEDFHGAVALGPLRLRWAGKWVEIEYPRLLVDAGMKCPFALWRHEHRFEPTADGGSVLTDRVEFRMPWHSGGPIADWFIKIFVFPVVFAGRHAATLAWFTRPGNSQNPLAGPPRP
jgi:ligand-binding SRPBCC domain-containing protein